MQIWIQVCHRNNTLVTLGAQIVMKIISNNTRQGSRLVQSHCCYCHLSINPQMLHISCLFMKALLVLQAIASLDLKNLCLYWYSTSILKSHVIPLIFLYGTSIPHFQVQENLLNYSKSEHLISNLFCQNYKTWRLSLCFFMSMSVSFSFISFIKHAFNAFYHHSENTFMCADSKTNYKKTKKTSHTWCIADVCFLHHPCINVAQSEWLRLS